MSSVMVRGTNNRMPSDNYLYFIEEASRTGEPVVIATLMNDSGGVGRIAFRRSGKSIGRLQDEVIIDEIKRLSSEILYSSDKVRVLSIADSSGNVYDVVIEVLRPKLKMFVFGAGHVGQAVSLIGAMLGYAVKVFDDRGDMLTRDRFPDCRIEMVRCIYEEMGITLEEFRGAVIVIVTRGHQYDEECLRAVIGSSASYIGMIGSRRRVLSILKRLSNDGISDHSLAKVHAPIGLRIGAVSPQEIAVSILAEVIQKLNYRGAGIIHTVD